MKDGHRYRIVLGGAAHVNSGEGYAIYINGKLLAESTRGVAVRQGGQPRGAHIYADFRGEFDRSSNAEPVGDGATGDGSNAGQPSPTGSALNKGKVTIAATSFLRYNHPRIKPYPPRGHLTLQIEEQKLPPIAGLTKKPL